MTTGTQTSRLCNAGFTLVELMVVVVLMGIVAVSVIPAMHNVRDMRSGAARDDIARMLNIAKARAMASGQPKGLLVDLEASSLSIVGIDADGAYAIESDPLTGRERAIDFAASHPGVTINTMTNGDGASGTGIVWFDYEATPHTRDSGGGFVAINAEPVEITTGAGLRVLVNAHSGLVETP